MHRPGLFADVLRRAEDPRRDPRGLARGVPGHRVLGSGEADQLRAHLPDRVRVDAGMPHQVAVTIVATVTDGHVGELEKLLGDLRGASGGLPFDRLPTLHFARLFVLEGTEDLSGVPIAPQLVFLSDIDGSAGAYLEALADTFGTRLDEVFGHCLGYPTGGSPTRADRIAYLERRTVRTAAAYVNTVGRSVEQVRREADLRRAIEEILDGADRPWSTMAPTQIRAAVRDFVFGDASFAWARRPATRPGLWWRAQEIAHAVLAPLVVLLLLPVLLVVLPVWAVMLRVRERSDVPEDARP